ncbi:carbohydrate kinase [Micromonospora purpureochromogenes]|uniref:carbohydrate kinase family protein n=1 Tax=Micromonospora purpureochromogenes TaxID=47872 RepID=UPI0034073894
MITVVGETLVDLIEETAGTMAAYPGGSPANVATALARLGQPTTLLTQIGYDAHGRMLRAYIEGNGVRLSQQSILNLAQTSVATTHLNPKGQATYDFNIEWQAFPGQMVEDAHGDCLHTGSLATVLQPGADDVLALVRRARPSTMISFDPNCRPSVTGDPIGARGRIDAFVSLSDVVKVSGDDLDWIYPGRPYQEAGRRWLALGAHVVVVTLGELGAWAATRRYEVEVAAHHTDVVDTVGAGDAFTAGMLAALSEADLLKAERRSTLAAADRAVLTEVVEFAAEVAARTCARRGANPPVRAELSVPRAEVSLGMLRTRRGAEID